MITRIGLWSGPRNLSTALMRSWENRPDTEVIDEPLYAHYLQATGLDHPGRDEILAAGPVDLDDAIARCLAPLPAGVEVSFQKHMSQHLLPHIDRAWLSGLRNVLLVRHPVKVLASYTRVREEVTLDEIGLPQQIELADKSELIVDADDLLTDPEWYMRSMCERLSVEFTSSMLTWPAGRRASDGCWAGHWYESVEASTGFHQAPTSPPPPIDSLRERLRPLATEALGLYRDLAARRIRLQAPTSGGSKTMGGNHSPD